MKAILPRFEQKPALVFWETTRACLLACLHCRAAAQREALPGELSTAEGRKLVWHVRDFGDPPPVLVFTGGDPLMRPDLWALLEEARAARLPAAVSPSVTPRLTTQVLRRFLALSVRMISVSLDGAGAATHDGIRGVPGTFEQTLGVLDTARNLGLPTQVNTTVMRRNVHELPEIFHLVRRFGVKAWEVFFLIPVGRAQQGYDLTADEYEAVCHFLYDAACYSGTVRTVEAPFLRRIVSEGSQGQMSASSLYHALRAKLLELEGPPQHPSSLPMYGTLDGDGIIFVAYDGTVYPGGLLPVPLGNIRDVSLVRLYREHELLHRIRSREFNGKCGRCPFRLYCGGSRARAFAYSSDVLGSDPACSYVPPPCG